MKIIVVGAGKVGQNIIEHLCSEGHQVVVIDSSSAIIEKMVNTYDCLGITGSAVDYDILKSAINPDADLIISATSSDEINILSCFIASSLGIKSTIARVRGLEYSAHIDWMRQHLGINMIINPESETSHEIVNIINFPEAIKVESFANGAVDLVELYIPSSSPLVGMNLMQIHQKYQVNLIVGVVERSEDAFIPKGDFVLEAGDRIHIFGTRGMIKTFLSKLGLVEGRITSCMIVGGGRISIYLAEELIANRIKVKIIEKDLEHCKRLSVLLPKAEVIYGDGTSQELLEEEGLLDMDALVSLAGPDEENIIISMYASKKKVPKIIAKINNYNFFNLLNTIGGPSIVSPKEITANKIISYVRNQTSVSSDILGLYKILHNEVEAVEFKARPNSSVLNIPLKDLQLKPHTLIVAIIRSDKIIIPGGLDEIKAGDSVIVVAQKATYDILDDIKE